MNGPESIFESTRVVLNIIVTIAFVGALRPEDGTSPITTESQINNHLMVMEMVIRAIVT